MEDIWSNTGKNPVHSHRAAVANRQTNYYEVLGLSPDAHQEMVREAYLRNKQIYGSDSSAFYSLMSSQEMADNRALIDMAFEVLSDPARRQRYNQQLGFAGSDIVDESANHVTNDLYSEQKFHSDRIVNARSSAPQQIEAAQELGWSEQSAMNVESVAVSIKRPLKVVSKVAPTAMSQQSQQEMEALIARSEIGDGKLFRELRLIAQVDEAEIQDRTKISLEYINALENNLFDRLPQLVYVRGFLRSYLQYINAPGFEQLVKAFTEKFEAWDKGRKNT